MTFAAINPFVIALSGTTAFDDAYPYCRWLNADCNRDGGDVRDINPFVALLET